MRDDCQTLPFSPRRGRVRSLHGHERSGTRGRAPLAVRRAPVISRPGRVPCPATPDQGASPLNPVSAAATLCQAVRLNGVCVLTQGRPRRPDTAVTRPLR